MQRLAPVFEALAPGLDAAPRTSGLTGNPAPPSTAGCTAAATGWSLREDGAQRHRVRPAGGVRRGLNIIKSADIGSAKVQHAWMPRRRRCATRSTTTSTSTSPQVAECGVGSVIGSWLLDLTAAALHDDPTWRRSAGRSPTPAKVAGRASPRSRKVPALVLTASSLQSASLPVASAASPTRCNLPSASSSVDTTRRSPTGVMTSGK